MEQLAENQNKEPEFDLMLIMNTLAAGRKWRHTYTQVLPDGRVTIQLKIEKRETCLLCGELFDEDHKLNCPNNPK